VYTQKHDVTARLQRLLNDEKIRTAVLRASVDTSKREPWYARQIKDGVQVVICHPKHQTTLRGEVEWQYQKLDAEQVVRRLMGIKGVTNLVTVKPCLTPSDLKKKIEHALVRSAELEAKNITVEMQGSKAILKGTVRAWAEREEAERAVWSAPGIAAVENRIRIET